MTTNAAIGHGTLFQLLDTSVGPNFFETLAEVTSITPPSLARDAVEATHTESPEKWREFIAGLKDAGEVTLELNFIPGGPAIERLLGLFNSDTFSVARLVFPNLVTWQFTALLTGVEPEAPVEDKMTASVTFKLTGKPGFIA
jgi:predicted secreted protein